jgi:translocation and assembly module TamB
MDTLFTNYDSLNFANVLGLDVAANIEVKKEAILNVIIDEANGDFIKLQGEALISAGVDPSGKITLVGNYTLEQGAYEISFDLLRRRFDIIKGSTITWTGEPTTASLDVTAKYIANTAPLDLVQDQISASDIAIRNTYLQKLPFEVMLYLKGELLKPEINFDIILPENRNYGVSNDIVTLVQSRLNELRQDEGDINKQVFSILLLGRFVGENPFQTSGEGFEFSSYARQSVSKLLTEQLNSLAAGLVSGVEIDFDVASTDDYTTGERRSRTDLNVGLSKRLLNDRLKISIGSNFQLEGPQNSNQKNNNIADNVALDYQLSKDGRYLIRFFRRNQYEGVVDGYIIENGLSFILSVDYNRFREVLKRKKQRVSKTGTGTTETTTGK